MGCSLDMAPLFPEWRRYMYQNILGWEPEVVAIREWPAAVPTATPVTA